MLVVWHCIRPCVFYADNTGENSANASRGKTGDLKGHTIGRCSNTFLLCFTHKTKDISLTPN